MSAGLSGRQRPPARGGPAPVNLQPGAAGSGRLFYGSTSELLRRPVEHRQGFVSSTSKRLPVALVCFEACVTAEQGR
jgi:hypothetical protein